MRIRSVYPLRVRTTAVSAQSWNPPYVSLFQLQISLKIDQKKLKAAHLDALKMWEAEINGKCLAAGEATIIIENVVDMDGPPAGFEYITDYMPMVYAVVLQHQ